MLQHGTVLPSMPETERSPLALNLCLLDCVSSSSPFSLDLVGFAAATGTATAVCVVGPQDDEVENTMPATSAATVAVTLGRNVAEPLAPPPRAVPSPGGAAVGALLVRHVFDALCYTAGPPPPLHGQRGRRPAGKQPALLRSSSKYTYRMDLFWRCIRI